MKVRYGLAAMFVGVVAMLIAIRDEGYLGGRTDGGPLLLGVNGSLSVPAAAGKARTFELMPQLEGDPVEIQAVRPDFASPGLRVRAPRSAGAPAVGASFDGDENLSLALRAKQPGAYYALNLIADYKRGIRRFRRYAEQSLCIAVGKDARCGSARVFDAPLAEIGGPSDYGVRMRGGGAVRLDATEPQSLEIPLVNLTGRTIKVADVGSSLSPGAYEVEATAAPSRFALRAHRGRVVKVDVDLEGCTGGGFIVLDELRARVDGDTVDVPLTVALQLSAPCPDAR